MNNSSSTSYDLNYFIVSMTVINAVIAILAAVLNFLIILTFAKNASLRTPSKILVLGLAVSDFCAGVIAEPTSCSMMIVYLTGNMELYELLYKVQNAVFLILVSVSFYNLTAITIDRFLAIHLHLRYQLLITPKHYQILIASVWIFSISWSMCLLFIDSEIPQIIDLVLYYGIMLLNGVLIWFIYRVINRHSAQISAQYHSTQSTLSLPRYKKSVKTMHFVVGAFALCYVPHSSLALVEIIRPTWDLRLGFTIAETIVMFNSVLNPLIYCWRIPDIKTAVEQILKGANRT